MRIEINYQKNIAKNVEAKQYVTKQPMGHWRNQRGNKKYLETKWKWKHKDPKPMGCSKSSSKREIYSNTILPQETRKASNRQPNFTPKTSGKRRTKNPKN